MKKLFIPLFALMVTATSCNSLLQEDPKYTINGQTLFESESDAQLALNGCYGYLTVYDTYGQAFWEVQEGASGLFWAKTDASIQDELASLKVLPNNSLTTMSWRGFYVAIANCNLFLSNLYASNLSDEFKAYTAAQAKFIRGLCYYNLVYTFGGVPLRLEPSTAENSNMPRSSKEEVLIQIESDWKDALENGLKAKEADSSLPSQLVANAYLAKLYWMMASEENSSSSPYWAKAKEYGDKVIGNYALEGNVATLFATGTTESVESIFKLNTSLYSIRDDQGNRTNWVFSPANSTNGISYGRVRISKAFHDDFRGTYPTDPRLDVTMLSRYKDAAGNDKYAYPFFLLNGNLESMIDYSDASINPTNPDPINISEPARKRFIDVGGGDHDGWPYLAKTFDPNAEAQRSNKQFFLYRYADLLLLMADVENELGNNSQSVSYLNQVLSRARNSVTPAAIHPQDVVANLSQEEMRLQIYRERLFELSGECFTFIETRRRGEEFFKTHIMEHYNSHLVTQSHTPVEVNNKFWDRLLPVASSKKVMLMPISQDELNANSAISSSDQNYGY